jgi:alcohol dehydrogenase class IV
LIRSPAADAQQGVPLIVAPTTAGTRSEATRFAVVYLDGKKYSVAHQFILPDYAIVDASLTESMPPPVTAETGLDAFCQAVESMWSVHSTEESIGYATEAIRLAWTHLQAAVRHPSRGDREAMCRAAHLAGKALNITRTTAPPALSYTITSKHGVAHGRAVALTLGAVLAFNHAIDGTNCIDPRGPDYVRKAIDNIIGLLGVQTASDAERSIRTFVASLDCPTRLAEVGVTTDEQIQEIAESVNAQRLANNPRRLTNQSLIAILQSIC